MDLDEAITVTKINTQSRPLYLLVGWQSKSFETYIYDRENIWKGRFSSNRLSGFSKNLQMSEKEYFYNTKKCLSQQRDDYLYELKSGFFYWKRKKNNSVIIEGFLPVELESPEVPRPDLTDILLALNTHLSEKINNYKRDFKSIKEEYRKCLKDTEEFLKLKVDMEKALCNKFLSLLNTKLTEVTSKSPYSDGFYVKNSAMDKLGIKIIDTSVQQKVV
ncbi:unnamed protein product [Danaus chrysippus]|uniref:(African queen) hypothetical protein n=1 Tax=Danaus chrysippus TaxID=151541 RepID=A0A8J2W2U1_9NEOP|nr:unnamed protein product [Danaus chrysippus]